MRVLGDLLFDDNEQCVTDEHTGGKKGSKVARFDLIPPEALAELASVYGIGEAKYPSDASGPNWEKGYSWKLSFGALCRHVWRWYMGESFDPATRCHHLAHAAWHCLALMTFESRKLGTDDRPKVKR